MHVYVYVCTHVCVYVYALSKCFSPRSPHSCARQTDRLLYHIFALCLHIDDFKCNPALIALDVNVRVVVMVVVVVMMVVVVIVVVVVVVCVCACVRPSQFIVCVCESVCV